MGTRLYPLTKNPDSLCLILGVPLDTPKRCDEIKRKHEGGDSYECYCEMNAHVDTGVYSSFLTFGWGKFEVPNDLKHIDELWEGPGKRFVSCAGSITDREICALILAHNGIVADLDLCEGLAWC